ncbi:hypothetical protein [Shewanella algae]|uniref:hypothetical protein n=1 Tax=Shewanella algae TaxID=38313 RepID=UPI0034D78E50
MPLQFQERQGLTRDLEIVNLSHSDNEDANWITLEVKMSEEPQLIIDAIDGFAKTTSFYERHCLTRIQENERRALAYKIRHVFLKSGRIADDIRSIDLSACKIQNNQTQ